MDWEACEGQQDVECHYYNVKAIVPEPMRPEPDHQFKKEDCDLLIGYSLSDMAKGHCLRAIWAYEEYYDYEYYVTLYGK